MKVSHRTMIALSGFVWLAVGVFLLSFGIHLILTGITQNFAQIVTHKFSLIGLFAKSFHDREQIALVLLCTALFVGYLKGKFVLSKSVNRQVNRIQKLPNPTSLKYLYTKGYLFLLAGMIALGITMRFLPITPDTRGAIDAAIGAALVNGALIYFRFATTSQGLLKK